MSGCKRVVEAAWDFWWGLEEGVRERLDPWAEAGPLLARLAPAKVLELVERLRDEDVGVRRAAAEALGAWHRQGLRFFQDAQGHWTVRTVEQLSTE